jgi:predicted amidohydrolase YtcJ
LKTSAAIIFTTLALVPALLAAQQAVPEAGPDLVFINGKIATMDSADSTVSAVAVKDGKILKVGSTSDITKIAGKSARVVDLGGKTVVPGLIDAHSHPMETMMMKESWVDCRYPGTPSVSKALENISAWAKKTAKGDWIFAACVSASENKFEEKRLPSRAELDRAAPENPVIVANGAHMAIASTAALKKLGITKGVSKLPHGGAAILDRGGEPTGTLTDSQSDVPMTQTPEELKRYYTKGIQEFWNSHGFTSVMAITPAEAMPVLQKLAAEGYQPAIRYSVAVWSSANGKDMPEDLTRYRMPKGADGAWYKFSAIKVWIDGENDCRTGYMYEPYKGRFETDPAGGVGSLVTPQPEAERFALIARKNNVIAMMHCSGDRATDIGLTAFEKTGGSGGWGTGMRIEHFGDFQLNEKQLDRARAMIGRGLRISVQPTWLLELVKANFENMGAERARTGFMFRKMIDAGLEPAAGTDVTGIYLDNINPFLAIYASVTRWSDKGLFEPEQAVSVAEAVRMWTVWAAKSMGEFDFKGSIEPGKYADMAVLSDDIFTIPKSGLKDVKVIKTIVGGRVVYEAK